MVLFAAAMQEGEMGAVAAKQEHDKRQVIVSRNPATGEVLGEVPEQGAEEVRAAVARAREAQRKWGQLGVRERAHRVLAFRDVIVRRADELCEAISREGGKTRAEALSMEV